MRSPSEIGFRLRQEVKNIHLWLAPPRWNGGLKIGAMGAMPAVSQVGRRLQGTCFAAELHQAADDILARRYQLFGHLDIPGDTLPWCEDRIHGITSANAYFRRVPYLDFARAGDHKIIWELNRHQHLVTLAQSWVLNPRSELLAEIEFQLQDWHRANPYQKGINWTSALEVAFRSLSWIWIARLVGGALSPDTQQLLAEGLYQHGCHLAENLSVYFSPNTHLLGEAVALHAIGKLFSYPEAEAWRRLGADIVRAEIEHQVHGDGGHFEHSDYYHVYALDMFLFHALLDEGVPQSYRVKLERMTEYLEALLWRAGRIPGLGDDDGGRFFYPHGERRAFGRATMVTASLFTGRPVPASCAGAWAEQAAWWINADAPVVAAAQAVMPLRVFGDTGVAVLSHEGAQLIADVGTFGFGAGGHSHADSLSFVARSGDDELLIDPGTYTYMADPAWRDRFRGTAAHNTVCIDGLDQAIAVNPFRWQGRPETKVIETRQDAQELRLVAECRYRGFSHRRQWIWLTAPGLLLVDDWIEGPPGEHRLEQFWHWGEPRFSERLMLPDDALVEQQEDWRSRALASKEPAAVTCVRRDTALPARMLAGLWLDGPGPRLKLDVQGDDIYIHDFPNFTNAGITNGSLHIRLAH